MPPGVGVGVAVGVGLGVGEGVGLGVGLGVGVGVGVGVGPGPLLMMTEAFLGQESRYPDPEVRVIVAVLVPDERFVVKGVMVTEPELLPAGMTTIPGVPLRV